VDLSPGERFGRYTIESRIGEGGMGTVYAAIDTKLERRVALKLLRADGEKGDAGGEGRSERMLREARAAASLEHPNAVRIHDVGEVGDVPYIAMELVVGQSLRTLIGEEMPLSTRLGWLVDVARALHAAHERGLVHRDVKPDNVMVGDDGTVKVLDFGIAWRDRAVRSDYATLGVGLDYPPWYLTLTAGNLVGNPRYMAPEQLRGEPLDGRADQFAWGVLAYELLAGVPPWRGDQSGAVQVSLTMLADVLENDPIPLRSVAPRVPRAVCAIVHRALSKEMSARFPTMNDVTIELLRAMAPRSPRTLVAAAPAVLLALVLGAFLVRDRHAVVGKPKAGPKAAVFEPSMREMTAEPPNIVLHLDAAEGVTLERGEVARWADLSGNENDAVAGKRAPTVMANAIHGHPAVHFTSGAYLSIADTQQLHMGTDDFVIAVVARHDRPVADKSITDFNLATGYGAILVKSEAEFPFRGVALIVNYPRPVRSSKLGVQTEYGHYVLSTSEHLNDDVPRLFEARREEGVLEVRINGVVEARLEGADDDVSSPGVPIGIGAHENQAHAIIQRFQGDIAEVVIESGGVTEARLAEMEDALLTKYGIARGAAN
jgi:serine/threonine-protein kinase